MRKKTPQSIHIPSGGIWIRVTRLIFQAIYLRITKISRFLTPPKYKNQPVHSQAERHVERQVLTIAFNLKLLGVEDVFIANAIGITLGKIVERYRRIHL